MAVFFDEQAVTFDQAPFGASHTTAIRDDLIAYLNAQGYSNSALSTLAPELLAYDPVAADSDPALNRLDNLTSYYVQGDVLHELPVSPPFYPMGFQTVISQNSVDVGSISLHSQALLTAFLENDAFRAITFKLPELLKMVFDEALYAYKTTPDNTKFVNFLEHLLRHQIGTSGTGSIAADAMLDRFTADLQKIAQDGGFTLTNAHITRTLVAFAMQKYYEEPASGADHGEELFSTVSGGIRFDRTDVADKLFDAKGWQLYFQNHLAEDLTLEEHQIVERLLPAAIDWFVQAGSVSMSATADVSKAFMVGGTGADRMIGGNEADLLLGNAGDDHLGGGKNNDTLLGGAGFDTYIFATGDGTDTVLDTDGAGAIVLNGQTLTGGALVAGTTNVWKNTAQGITYTLKGSGASQLLLISKDGSSDGIRVQGWQAGQLGLTLSGALAPAAPGVITGIDGYSDSLTGSGGADRILGLSGNDALDGSAGDDVIEGGVGDDLIAGGAGSDLIYGGSGRDMILSATGLNAPQRDANGDGVYEDWVPPAGAGTVWTRGRTWGIYASTDSNGEIYVVDGCGPESQDSAGDIDDACASTAVEKGLKAQPKPISRKASHPSPSPSGSHCAASRSSRRAPPHRCTSGANPTRMPAFPATSPRTPALRARQGRFVSPVQGVCPHPHWKRTQFIDRQSINSNMA